MSAAGWHHDPTGKYEYRWWNGTHWTTDVWSHGVASVDPMPHDPAAHSTAHPLSGPPVAPPVAPPGLPPPTMPAPVAATAATTWPVQPVPPPTAPPTALPPRRRTAALLGGVAAIAALGVGAFVVLGGDDAPTAATSTTAAVSSTLDAATTVPPTSVATTLAATTSTTAVATTLPPPIDVTGALLAAMPTIGGVPEDWLLFEGSDADPELHDDSGYCGGPNWAAAAAGQGAVGMVHGASWDLPNGGWFGLSAFTFATADDAAAYLATIDRQANGCMTDPVVFETPETEYDLFADGFGEDAIWNTAEVNASFPGSTTVADETILVIYEEFVSTTTQGTDFSLVWTEFQRFERHGRTVVAYWLWGEHDVVGFGNAAEATSYTPTEADLDATAAIIRSVIVERLRADGLA